MSVVFTPNHFDICKKITWDDVILKLSNEMENKTYSLALNQDDIMNMLSYPFSQQKDFPGLRLQNQYYPNTILDAFNYVKEKTKVEILKIYLSFCKDNSTFGRHNDIMDVLIVQAIGEVSYRFDDGSIYDLTPGDSIFIPKGTYHDPIVKSTRVTLSFSWE